MKRLLLIALVLVLAGCGGLLPGETESEPPEVLIEFGNASYDDELEIDPEDGFSEAELDKWVNRSMARIQIVRGLEFERPVAVEVISRETYQERRGNQSTDTTRSAWNNQIWRGLFLVGQDRDVTRVLDEAFGDAVQGYYEPGRDSIVIVSDSETPTIQKETLIHELVHALQDQQFGLEFGHDTRDEQAAYDTLIEGEAELIPQLYMDRCGEWSCLEPPTEQEPSGQIDPGVWLILTQPYTQGVGFVTELRERNGWDAVDQAHENPPRSTAQTINPDRYPDSDHRNVSVADRSTEEWERFDHFPEGDTLGEASIFSMLVANDVIEPDDPASYAHPISNGWDGDQLVPYRSGEEHGYVWEIAWESADDAAAFADAYEELLDEHDGLIRGQGSYMIENGPFEGAYRLTRTGDTVRIVNAPSVAALSKIYEQ